MTYRTPIVVGDRVALAPHLDLWMAGVRFGVVDTIHADEGAPRRYLVQCTPGDDVWLTDEDILGAVNPIPGQYAGASTSTVPPDEVADLIHDERVAKSTDWLDD